MQPSTGTLVIWMFFQSSRSHKKYQLWQDASKIPVSFLVEDFSFLLQLTNKRTPVEVIFVWFCLCFEDKNLADHL